MKLSLALATHNEEANIEACIASCKGLVDEVVVVDGSSTDKTAEIAHKMGARVLITSNPSMFHINKQKAIDAATGEWILQLDADERVSPELAGEIKKVIKMSEGELEEYEKNLLEKELFERHENIVISSQNGGLSRHLPHQGSPPNRRGPRCWGPPMTRHPFCHPTMPFSSPVSTFSSVNICGMVEYIQMG